MIQDIGEHTFDNQYHSRVRLTGSLMHCIMKTMRLL